MAYPSNPSSLQHKKDKTNWGVFQHQHNIANAYIHVLLQLNDYVDLV